MPKRASDWGAFLRTLLLLKHLQQAPATALELIEAVQKTLGKDCYPADPGARRDAFKHDRERLRDRFLADFHFDPKNHLYILDDPGPFGALTLGEDSLRGLALLARDFGNGLGERVYLRDLLNELIGRLSSENRRLLESQPESPVIGMRQFVDKGNISTRVWETVQKATEKRRKLSFRYLSPRYKDNLPVYFEVSPIHLKYQDGHWYLRAWMLKREPQEFPGGEPEYIRFRLTYIQEDEALKLWPTVFPERFRTPPRYLVEYELTPEIGRGEISHHFAETQITRQADGRACVRGFTDDIWEAGRLLLAYGEGCIVWGGQELRREMERRVEGMARNYGFFVE